MVVGVEGKADEPFDDPLPTWRDKRVKATATSKAPLRLDRLTTYFFGSTLDSDERLHTVGYQLVSALAGTLADAYKEKARWAVLLIHEFVTSKTNDEKHAANAQALDGFITLLAGGELPRTGSEDAWIAGPLTVAGDGEHLAASTDIFVGRLVTRRR